MLIIFIKAMYIGIFNQEENFVNISFITNESSLERTNPLDSSIGLSSFFSFSTSLCILEKILLL